MRKKRSSSTSGDSDGTMATTTVIKTGGASVARAASLDALWAAVAERIDGGERVVVVHGGGAQATDVAERLGHTPRMVHGRRVTTDIDLRIVQWTLRGELNGRLAAHAARRGVRAAGLSGADGPILYVTKRPPWEVDGETIDFGWVGDIESVDTDLLDLLLDRGYVPVVAPIGVDRAGHLYNVNADTVSRALAEALRADEFLLVTEVGGVRRRADDPDSLLPSFDAEQHARGVRDGWITDGMRVKIDTAFAALRAGISRVFIVSPEGLRDPSTGTRIVHSL